MKRPTGVTIDSLRYRPERTSEIAKAEIVPPWRPLARLKGANPEVFFFWLQAQRLLDR